MLPFLDSVLDKILPLPCICCGKSRDGGGCYLCCACQDQIPVIFPPYCTRCGFPSSVDYDLPDSEYICGTCRKRPYRFEQARSLGVYQSVLKDLVKFYKFNKQPRTIREIAPLLQDYFQNQHDDYNGWIVVPVPLHIKKLKDRGFDQSWLLALEVARTLGMPGPLQGLKRVQETPAQSKMSRVQRMRNIRGAFEVVDANRVSGRDILLIDDVMTTGATFNEATRTLKKAGAGKVHVFSLARTL